MGNGGGSDVELNPVRVGIEVLNAMKQAGESGERYLSFRIAALSDQFPLLPDIFRSAFKIAIIEVEAALGLKQILEAVAEDDELELLGVEHSLVGGAGEGTVNG